MSGDKGGNPTAKKAVKDIDVAIDKLEHAKQVLAQLRQTRGQLGNAYKVLREVSRKVDHIPDKKQPYVGQDRHDLLDKIEFARGDKAVADQCLVLKTNELAAQITELETQKYDLESKLTDAQSEARKALKTLGKKQKVNPAVYDKLLAENVQLEVIAKDLARSAESWREKAIARKELLHDLHGVYKQIISEANKQAHALGYKSEIKTIEDALAFPDHASKRLEGLAEYVQNTLRPYIQDKKLLDPQGTMSELEVAHKLLNTPYTQLISVVFDYLETSNNETHQALTTLEKETSDRLAQKENAILTKDARIATLIEEKSKSNEKYHDLRRAEHDLVQLIVGIETKENDEINAAVAQGTLDKVAGNKTYVEKLQASGIEGVRVHVEQMYAIIDELQKMVLTGGSRLPTTDGQRAALEERLNELTEYEKQHGASRATTTVITTFQKALEESKKPATTQFPIPLDKSNFYESFWEILRKNGFGKEANGFDVAMYVNTPQGVIRKFEGILNLFGELRSDVRKYLMAKQRDDAKIVELEYNQDNLLTERDVLSFDYAKQGVEKAGLERNINELNAYLDRIHRNPDYQTVLRAVEHNVMGVLPKEEVRQYTDQIMDKVLSSKDEVSPSQASRMITALTNHLGHGSIKNVSEAVTQLITGWSPRYDGMFRDGVSRMENILKSAPRDNGHAVAAYVLQRL
jgi:hypothetical protein